MNINLLQKKLIRKIDAFDFSNFEDKDFLIKTEELRRKIRKGTKIEKILFEAFALVREASIRTLGLKHFNTQLIGGYILNKGAVAEMSTGAGKTLTATLPVYLNALNGKGVHVVTVNDYLAKRDCEWMMPVYEKLGMTCGYIINETTQEERKEIYRKDIVYITNSELGFDYLRDNMVKNKADRVQRGYFNYAIIDEADSILIDESRTPLIISAKGEESIEIYVACDMFVKRLKENDIEKDEESKIYLLTESGIRKAERVFSLKNYADNENMIIRHHIEQALKANYDMKKDKDYIVQDGEILIIDEHTGRIANGRRYNQGLHQAIEAKENVQIKNESITLAQITYQNFFKQYEKFSGMTGTAMTEKKEFKEIYGLKVINIPDANKRIRIDKPDLIYITEEAKLKAIVKDVEENYKKGRPVLIGTPDIAKSEVLSQMLTKEGIPHNLLNAKQNQQEAEIVAKAGQVGSVTIATNMAGRGTDIKLGKGADKLGGLKIIASERAIDRRIDNQLIGRAGRQGDPGESQFYLSFDDELMEYAAGYNKEKIELLDKNDINPIDNKIFSSLINNCQKKIENKNFEIRKNTTKYDKIFNTQRENIYKQRNYVLENDCGSLVINMVSTVFRTEFERLGEDKIKSFEKIFNIKIDSLEGAISNGEEKMKYYINNLEDKEYLNQVILQIVDVYWRFHMENLELLRQDVRGASYRNEDPVYVFNKKASEMFEEMNYNIKRDIVRNILIAF